MQFWNGSCSSLKIKAKKGKLETERRIFFPGLREVIWLSEGGRHSASSLEESKSAFQVVINTWKVISAARRARRPSCRWRDWPRQGASGKGIMS